MVIGFSFFVLYLDVANWLWVLNLTSLPLGAAVNSLVTSVTLVNVSFLVVFVAYRAGQVAKQNANSNL
jgi:hypothetical protein